MRASGNEVINLNDEGVAANRRERRLFKQ